MAKISFTIRLCILLLGASLSSCAQTKLGIVKAGAYMQLNMPGNIPVGDEHKGPDTLYRVYIETLAHRKFIWGAAYIGNIAYNILSYKATPPVNIGNLSSTGEAAIITAKKGNTLWQLNLEINKSTDRLSKNIPGLKNGVILKLTTKKKIHFYKIQPIQELQPEMHM